MAVPTAVVNEFPLLRVLLGHIENLELLGLVLAGSWQFQLLQLEDLIKYGDLRGLEPLARVPEAVLVLVSTPLMLEGVGAGSWQVFPLPCIDLDEILLLGFRYEGVRPVEVPVVVRRLVALDAPGEHACRGFLKTV